MAAIQDATGVDLDADVVIVGAGITGIYQLYRLREAGFSVLLLDAAGGAGGTWFWNRYPASRFDSESYSYGYFFSPELLGEWEWSEHYAGQPEIESYLNHVIDRFDLRSSMRFNTRVVSTEFEDEANAWTLRSDEGRTFRARFVIAATGILSIPFTPMVPQAGAFRGEVLHTGEWPHGDVSFAGKRVAVIGNGSSGVQIVPPIAQEAESLVVYQRTPNWCTPLNNSPITPEQQLEIMSSHEDIYAKTQLSPTGFMYRPLEKLTFDDSASARRAEYERMWNSAGHASYLNNYADLVTNPAANAEFCAFLEEQIRAIVTDSETADKLIPKDHGFGGKRPPLVTGYYETFNRENVDLVDLRATPFVKFVEDGIETTDGLRSFDMIIWATGFDAVTGAIMRLGIVGPDGSLEDKWADGPVTLLGLQTPGFPNLFFVGGPHSTAGNIPRSTQMHVEFVADLLVHMRETDVDRVEPSQAAAEAWTRHVYETAPTAGSSVGPAESNWNYGSNIPGRTPRLLMYRHGLPTYRERARKVQSNGFEGFEMCRTRSRVH